MTYAISWISLDNNDNLSRPLTPKYLTDINDNNMVKIQGQGRKLPSFQQGCRLTSIYEVNKTWVDTLLISF